MTEELQFIDKFKEELLKIGSNGFDALVAREAVEGFVQAGFFVVISVAASICAVKLFKACNEQSDLVGPMIFAVVVAIGFGISTIYCFLNALFPEATVIRGLMMYAS